MINPGYKIDYSIDLDFVLIFHLKLIGAIVRHKQTTGNGDILSSVPGPSEIEEHNEDVYKSYFPLWPWPIDRQTLRQIQQNEPKVDKYHRTRPFYQSWVLLHAWEGDEYDFDAPKLQSHLKAVGRRWAKVPEAHHNLGEPIIFTSYGNQPHRIAKTIIVSAHEARQRFRKYWDTSVVKDIDVGVTTALLDNTIPAEEWLLASHPSLVGLSRQTLERWVLENGKCDAQPANWTASSDSEVDCADSEEDHLSTRYSQSKEDPLSITHEQLKEDPSSTGHNQSEAITIDSNGSSDESSGNDTSTEDDSQDRDSQDENQDEEELVEQGISKKRKEPLEELLSNKRSRPTQDSSQGHAESSHKHIPGLDGTDESANLETSSANNGSQSHDANRATFQETGPATRVGQEVRTDDDSDTLPHQSPSPSLAGSSTRPSPAVRSVDPNRPQTPPERRSGHSRGPTQYALKRDSPPVLSDPKNPKDSLRQYARPGVIQRKAIEAGLVVQRPAHEQLAPEDWDSYAIQLRSPLAPLNDVNSNKMIKEVIDRLKGLPSHYHGATTSQVCSLNVNIRLPPAPQSENSIDVLTLQHLIYIMIIFEDEIQRLIPWDRRVNNQATIANLVDTWSNKDYFRDRLATAAAIEEQRQSQSVVIEGLDSDNDRVRDKAESLFPPPRHEPLYKIHRAIFGKEKKWHNLEDLIALFQTDRRLGKPMKEPRMHPDFSVDLHRFAQKEPEPIITFRHHEGVLREDMIYQWVQFCSGLVRLANYMAYYYLAIKHNTELFPELELEPTPNLDGRGYWFQSWHDSIDIFTLFDHMELGILGRNYFRKRMAFFATQPQAGPVAESPPDEVENPRPPGPPPKGRKLPRDLSRKYSGISKPDGRFGSSSERSKASLAAMRKMFRANPA